MSSMSEANLEKKFQTVSNTQDSIQSLSLWILHHKAHCNKIVHVWMKVLKKAKIGHRLTLFYLANDVIQNGRRKGAIQFLAAFAEVLREAILLLKDDKIKGSIERVLRIWEDRNIYSSEVISDLLDILRVQIVVVTEPKLTTKRSAHGKRKTSHGPLHPPRQRGSAKICKDSTAKILAEFKPEHVSSYIKKIQKVDQDLVSKLAALNGSKLDAATSGVLSQLKDRSHGQQFSKDFDDATRCLEDYIKTMEKEIGVRQELIEVLEQAEIYYDTQRGEARVVANAYKNFAARVKTQKKKLEEQALKLPSPVPSPCEDAPSPSNSEGLELSPVLEAPEASPPSPIGTPDGLKMSPVAANDKDPAVAGALNSFLPQAPGMMTSWLDSFTATVAAPTSQASSLDSRLLNFMQNLPGTPSKSETPATKSAIITPEPKTAIISGDSGGGTPVKDEHSGQGTPVQDEDTQTNPQQMLSKLISMAKGGKEASENVLKKFSPIADLDERVLEKVQCQETKEAKNDDFFNSLLDKDWRIVPGATHMDIDQVFPSKESWRNGKEDKNSENESDVEKVKPFSSSYDTPKTENEMFSPSYQTSDSLFSDSINIMGTPPWNTSSSYQTAEGFKKLTEEDTVADREDAFSKPLQPPPKPSFPGFDIFNSPPPLSTSTKDPEPQFKNNSSASSVQSALKSRQDPRLNSQNYSIVPKGTVNEGRVRDHGKQEGDDMGVMDMDLEDSDNEQEHSENVDACNEHPSDDTEKTDEETVVSVRPNVPETSPLSSENKEDLSQQHTRHNDHFPFIQDERGSTPITSNNQSNYMGDINSKTITFNNRPDYSAEMDSTPVKSNDESDSATEMGLTPKRSNSMTDFSSDGDPNPNSGRLSDHLDFLADTGPTPIRSNNQQDYIDNAGFPPLRSDNLSEKPIGNPGPLRPPDRFMYSPDRPRDEFSPEANFMSPPYHHDRHMPPPIRERDMFPGGPMPMRGFPMDKELNWRACPWPPPSPHREPPWRGPRPRYEDNGYPYDGYDRRGPGFDFGPPPPMKRFPPPPPYFGRERRGFFAPRHH